MPTSARARSLFRRHSGWLFGLVVICSIGAAVLISPGVRKCQVWSSSVEETRRQVAVLNQRKSALLDQFTIGQEAMLERKAHELGQVKPGEVLIQVVPSPEARAPLQALRQYWYPQRELEPEVPALILEKPKKTSPSPKVLPPSTDK